ncbi:MAG: type II toxin-antitoxin system death-on-curing family toxin [Ignavibacteria bacterium]|nr:type II toxin-antitoxin system death-on-curing family toxin [Ignavibacteria bacterium]
MMNLKEVLEIHEVLIERFGGSKGLRDKGLLASSLNRMYQTFDNAELYPTIIDKATALIESIIKNHPFVDGNKRVGYTLMRLLLLENGLDIVASQDEKYDFVISIASGKFSFEEIKNWLENKIR